MSWQRKNGRSYYCHSSRINGKMIHKYVGGGQRGEEAAAQDRQRRAVREAQAQSRRDENEVWQDSEEPLQDYCRATDVLMAAALVTAGFHRHARSQWRLKRHERP